MFTYSIACSHSTASPEVSIFNELLVKRPTILTAPHQLNASEPGIPSRWPRAKITELLIRKPPYTRPNLANLILVSNDGEEQID